MNKGKRATREDGKVHLESPQVRGTKVKGTPGRELMEAGCITEQTRPLHDVLKDRVIGQSSAMEALTCSYARVLSGLRDPARPVLTVLLLGPTGVGKTETAKVLAQNLFGSEDSLCRVNCEEYAHGHEMSKLLGSPPGYVGYNIEPLLSQRRIDSHHRLALKAGTGVVGQAAGKLQEVFPAEEGKCLSVTLFDEIEKAHPTLWNAMLGLLDGGKLTLGDNTTTDFTRSIIIMTSNVGSRAMSEVHEKRAIGFKPDDEEAPADESDLQKIALAAARRTFPLEFLNRFDEILVYSALKREHLDRIFDKFLNDIHVRAINQAGVPFLVRVARPAREMILDRGTDLSLGARPLRRAMEVELVDPISRLLASEQLHAGDVIEVEREGDRLVFYRGERSEPALVV